MKKIEGLRKIAIRLNGTTSKAYEMLAENVIGSKKILAAPGLTVYVLVDGTIMELYGPGADFPAYLFADSDVVVSYRVSNLDEALVELTRSGAEVVAVMDCDQGSFRFCHIRITGQSLFGIYEERELSTAS
ncbi:hypothetical protein ACRQ5D_22150 [Mucilaginibacter sp. P25]|uniref:VOC domain-containing protein n=1 Tax=Mucilaginibacter gossypii TaxID=551996 RepID=A0A1G8NQ72_9SPHI|nr:hypothetical protein [Mucilaginibacter gossypii]SDI82419.1 hypothetical protein SAMN05192573_13516 [Mucilaginibacter gossypii]